jgi:hypothetical protein
MDNQIITDNQIRLLNLMILSIDNVNCEYIFKINKLTLNEYVSLLVSWFYSRDF